MQSKTKKAKVTGASASISKEESEMIPVSCFYTEILQLLKKYSIYSCQQNGLLVFGISKESNWLTFGSTILMIVGKGNRGRKVRAKNTVNLFVCRAHQVNIRAVQWRSTTCKIFQLGE